MADIVPNDDRPAQKIGKGVRGQPWEVDGDIRPSKKHLIAPCQERKSVDAPTEHCTEDVECLASNVGESEVVDDEQELIDCLIIGTIKVGRLEDDGEASTVKTLSPTRSIVLQIWSLY